LAQGGNHTPCLTHAFHISPVLEHNFSTGLPLCIRVSIGNMLLPMNPGMMQQDTPVPEAIKNRHVYGWYCMIILLMSIGCAEIVGGDAMAAFFFMFLAGIVTYMVSDGCKQMTMQCLLLFGVMVGFQALFEFMALLSVVNGRSTETTTMQNAELNKAGTETEEITYVTKIIIHPLFDKAMGRKYNVQSAALVASPLVLVLCTFFCYISYNAYTSSLFEDDVETGPLSGGLAGRSYGGYAGPQPGRRAEPQRSTPQGSAARIFEGHGQRLGS